MSATVVSRYGGPHEPFDDERHMRQNHHTSKRLAPAGANSAGGSINFRLARERTIMAYKSGEATRSEVCDAQRELMRNATECGTATTTRCPICHDADLVEVLYVFGPRLPAEGRCIVTEGDLERIRRRKGNFTAYDVEVCVKCKWNHLLRTNPVV